MVNSIGEAYAFWNYEGKTEDIEKQLPVIRKTALTPSDLELCLTRVDNLDTAEDPALADILQQAKDVKMNHVLKATLPNAGNREVAKELGYILSVIYGLMYEIGGDFFKRIVYKIGDQYILADASDLLGTV